MNLFRWRGRRSDLQQGRTAFQFTEEVSEEEIFDAATVLLDLEESGDLEEVLGVLDSCLEKIQQQGKEAKVHRLVARVEEEFQQKPVGPHQLAQLAAVYQRLEEGDRSSCLHRALGLSVEALRRYREAGARRGTAIVLNNMGIVYNELGASSPKFFQKAIPALEEALRFYKEENEADRQLSIYMSLGDAYAGLEEPGPDHLELALEYYDRVWSLSGKSGVRLEQAAAMGRLGEVQFQLGAYYGDEALAKAEKHFRDSLNIYVEEQKPSDCAYYQTCLAEVYLALSRSGKEYLVQALHAYEGALEFYEKASDRGHVADTCMEMARLHQDLRGRDQGGHLSSAVELYFKAMKINQDLGRDAERGAALQELALIYLDAGAGSASADVAQAMRCMEEAAQAFEEADLKDEYRTVVDQLEQVRRFFAPPPPS